MASESIEQQLVDLKRENAALTERIAQLNRTENTLNAILKGTIAETGYDFFVSLVKHVATALQAKYALIGELVGPNKDQVKTIAFWNDGATGANFAYELSGSPCATVIAGGVQYYTNNTWRMFPEDKGLEKKHIECYIGAPMFDSMGDPLGVLVVMHDNVLEMGIDSVPIISLFAARAGPNWRVSDMRKSCANRKGVIDIWWSSRMRSFIWRLTAVSNLSMSVFASCSR